MAGVVARFTWYKKVESSSPGQCTYVVFLGKTQCLFPPRCINGNQQIAWGQPDKMLGGNLRWTSISARGRRNTLSRFILQKPEMSAGLMGLLTRPISIGAEFISPNFGARQQYASFHDFYMSRIVLTSKPLCPLMWPADHKSFPQYFPNKMA